LPQLERKPEYSNKELAQPKTKRMHYPYQLGDESQLPIPYHSLTNFITLVLSGLLHVRGQGESWTGPFNADFALQGVCIDLENCI